MHSSAELLAKALKRATEERGAKASILRKTGFSQSQLDRYISGEMVPGLEALDRLAAALEVSPVALISDLEDQPWSRVPKHLLVAIAQVDPTHYPIILNFLESFTIEREHSRVAKVTERLEDPSRDRKKRPK